MDSGKAAASLERWFRAHPRDLPWRRDPDPYHVLVAEFILQQTRMGTALPYYARFLRRFPTVEALARAPEREVLRLWSGLGYYRRARHLHRTARLIVGEHGGRVPDDPAVLDALPGIGPYTAGAIASVGYDRPAPAIDGNQARVIGRVLGLRAVAGAKARARMEAWAGRLLAQGSPRRLNQALMDLGGAVCLPERPRCGACPLGLLCLSRSRMERSSPRRRPAARTPTESWDALVYLRGGRVWLARPRDHGLLAGLWLPPLRRASRRAGAPDFVHVFSHKRWRVHLVRPRGPPRGPGRWVRPHDLSTLPHGRLTRRVLEATFPSHAA